MTKMSKRFGKVQSKIKDQVAYFKSLAKDQSNRQMFNKDPIVYANPHPAEQDYGYTGNHHPSVQKNASLRVRSQSIEVSEEPSSSVLDVRGSNVSSSGQGYYPQQY